MKSIHGTTQKSGIPGLGTNTSAETGSDFEDDQDVDHPKDHNEAHDSGCASAVCNMKEFITKYAVDIEIPGFYI